MRRDEGVIDMNLQTLKYNVFNTIHLQIYTHKTKIHNPALCINKTNYKHINYKYLIKLYYNSEKKKPQSSLYFNLKF